MGATGRKQRGSLKQWVVCVGMTAAVTFTATSIFHARTDTPTHVVTLVFDSFSCRPFTVFYDPTLDPMKHSFSVRIRPKGPQAIRMPEDDTALSFWDVNGNGAYKTELSIGTFGPPDSNGATDARISYSILAIGAELPCGREELAAASPNSIQRLFGQAIVVETK